LIVNTYHPRLNVTLIKSNRRSGQGFAGRYDTQPSEEDITPLLGEHCRVQTSKSLHAPTGGFTITVTDQPGKNSDTIYAMIEPMDYVEIRMARNPHDHIGGKLPIIMRGVVDHIARHESMGTDGKPTRSVTVSGSDAGKFFLMGQLFWAKSYILNPFQTASFSVFEHFGKNIGNMKASDFMTLCHSIIDEWITMSKLSSYWQINTDFTVKNGYIGPWGVNAENAENVWNLMEMNGDVGVWNELFIEDRDGSSVLVYRPTPFRALKDNALIHPEATAAKTVEITAEHIEESNLSRTDANVANYFWVTQSRAQNIADSSMLLFDAAKKVTDLIDDTPNNTESIFSWKKMEAQTTQTGSAANNAQAMKEGEIKTYDDTMLDWLAQRRKILKEFNRDNVAFESGTLRLMGNEKIKPGIDLKVTRGNLKWQGYVTQVEHDFQPYQHYTTTVNLERVTSFWTRAHEDKNPWLSERSQKDTK
jgi:hypothetical protein